jgi:hypothetical protein
MWGPPVGCGIPTKEGAEIWKDLEEKRSEGLGEGRRERAREA